MIFRDELPQTALAGSLRTAERESAATAGARPVRLQKRVKRKLRAASYNAALVPDIHDVKEADIILLLGPSGSGKTTLGSWLAEDLGMLHLELDRPEADGIDLEGLRPEWDALIDTGQPADLASVIRGRAARAGRQGAVLTFTSLMILNVAVIHAAEQTGIRSLVLYGTREECLAAFLRREQATARGLTREYWEEHNDASLIQFSRAEFAPHRVSTFVKGERRTRADLVADVRTRL